MAILVARAQPEAVAMEEAPEVTAAARVTVADRPKVASMPQLEEEDHHHLMEGVTVAAMAAEAHLMASKVVAMAKTKE